jgi:shikimate kinase
MKVYIVGYMGSGKSSLAPKLASALNLPYIDLDTYFEQKYKITIPLFFEKYGEVPFRSIEHQLLKEVALLSDFVLATGGGTPCFHDNMKLMNSTGVTIYLMLSPETLCKRLKKSKSKRPVLKTFDNEKLEEHIREHLHEREFYYKQAQIILDNLSPDPSKITQYILSQLPFRNET